MLRKLLYHPYTFFTGFRLSAFYANRHPAGSCHLFPRIHHIHHVHLRLETGGQFTGPHKRFKRCSRTIYWYQNFLNIHYVSSLSDYRKQPFCNEG